MAKRSGGVLTAILGSIVAGHTVSGSSQRKDALGETVMAHRCDEPRTTTIGRTFVGFFSRWHGAIPGDAGNGQIGHGSASL